MGMWSAESISDIPCVMVTRDTPDTLLTQDIPPRPIDFASLARYNLRCRSFSRGNMFFIRSIV
jgi:hypothetical protein